MSIVDLFAGVTKCIYIIQSLHTGTCYMLLNTTPVKWMNIEWKKAVRRTLNLPKTTISKFIPLLAGNRSFQEQHERRWGALHVRMMQSENVLVQYMAR